MVRAWKREKKINVRERELVIKCKRNKMNKINEWTKENVNEWNNVSGKKIDEWMKGKEIENCTQWWLLILHMETCCHTLIKQ